MVGISTDRPKAQRRFAERLGLTYPMLCDEEGATVRAYGVRGLLGLAKRVSFLIDPEGRVARVWTKVSPGKHPAEVLAELRRAAG